MLSLALHLATSFFAGGLTYPLPEIIGEAHEAAEDSRWAVLAIVGGFVLFAFVAGFPRLYE